MKIPAPRYDYRGFTLKKIWQPEYRHLLYWIFWPVFVLRYLVIEQIPALGPYHVMHCTLDDLIPFCEWFLIPYGFWFVTLVATHLYTMFYDVKEFKRYSQFLLISVTISTTMFLVFPSCQNLRPETFARDNLLTKIMTFVYWFDTSTNVCPSEHVIGSVAVLAAVYHCRHLRNPLRLTVITVVMVLIILSTVFLKQHSVLDMLAAVPICMLAYWIVYGRKFKRV